VSAFPEAPDFDLEHIFGPTFTGDQSTVDRMEENMKAAKVFAEVIQRNTPRGADQSDAIRKVREALSSANSAIALGGRLRLIPAMKPS